MSVCMWVKIEALIHTHIKMHFNTQTHTHTHYILERKQNKLFHSCSEMFLSTVKDFCIFTVDKCCILLVVEVKIDVTCWFIRGYVVLNNSNIHCTWVDFMTAFHISYMLHSIRHLIAFVFLFHLEVCYCFLFRVTLCCLLPALRELSHSICSRSNLWRLAYISLYHTTNKIYPACNTLRSYLPDIIWEF